MPLRVTWTGAYLYLCKKPKEKVLYVWFEAPIGYIAATQAWAKAHNKDWKEFWQDPATKLVHFVGKDNIVFHCLIFPVMLKAHGQYILPQNVPANEFMNLEGKKISTSRDHAIWLHDYLKDHPEGQDVLRYVLCAGAPETKDSNFTWQDLKAKNNNELVAIVGNFVHRTLVLMHKYFQGKVPPPGAQEDIDKAVLDQVRSLVKQISTSLEQYKISQSPGLVAGPGTCRQQVPGRYHPLENLCNRSFAHCNSFVHSAADRRSCSCSRHAFCAFYQPAIGRHARVLPNHLATSR